MSRDVGVCDLPGTASSPHAGDGESLDEVLGSPFATLPAQVVPKPARTPSRWDRLGRAVGRGALLEGWPGLTRTLSLFVPGAGQLVQGQVSLGLFFLSATLFLISFGWAILETLDRLVATFQLLDYPLLILFWALGAVYGLAGLVHLAGVLSVVDSERDAYEVDYHPVLPAAASSLVPGWGQLLNGDRIRAGLFVAGLWVVGAVWIAISPAATLLLSQHLPGVSPLEQALREPVLVWSIQWTFPVVLWTLAVYDAAVSAAHRRD